MTKKCSRCLNTKSHNEFFKNSGNTVDGLRNQCKPCFYSHRKEMGFRVKWGQKLKLSAISAYGSVCYCCGESKLPFLNLDHEFGGGTQDRKKLPGSSFYHWLKQNNYPKNLGLRVACWNCNCGRQMNNGICPHQEEMSQLLGKATN